MTYFRILGIFVLIITTVLSCTEVVDVDVPNGGDRLVVEASINWEKGTDGKQQSISLSRSTPFFAKEKIVPVTTAKVSVFKNDDNQEIVFESNNDGTYKTDSFIPELNKSYTLKIEHNGKFYEATETLIPTPEITKLAISTERGFDKDEPELNVYFNDPPNQRNFYMSTFYTPVNDFPDIETFNDRFQDGLEIDFWYEEDFEDGDVIVASLMAVSEAFYYYMDLFFSQQGGGGPFQTTPAQMVGNCKNVNDPSEEVFGYFNLSEIVTVSEVYKEK